MNQLRFIICCEKGVNNPHSIAKIQRESGSWIVFHHIMMNFYDSYLLLRYDGESSEQLLCFYIISNHGYKTKLVSYLYFMFIWIWLRAKCSTSHLIYNLECWSNCSKWLKLLLRQGGLCLGVPVTAFLAANILIIILVACWNSDHLAL